MDNTFSLPKIPGYEMEITDDQTKLTGDTLAIDFETFYDKGYSLSKMTTQEYILDPRFQVIGVSIAVDNAEPEWYTGAAVKPALDAIDWKLSTLLAQNTKFDGAILAWKYGHIPGFLVDTMSMAVTTGLSRAAHGASLAALTKHLIEHGYPVPPKGDEVVKALGKRLEDFRPEQLDAYGEYCKDDVRITRYIFNLLADMLPDAELMWHDFVMRMYIEPRFVLDAPTIDNELVRVHARRAEVATEVMAKLGIDSNVEFMKSIMSNPKFAAAIESYGGEPPLKISKTTGKETFAFARTDEGMLALLEDDNEYVRALAEARLGLKSSIEVTRCERFRDLAKLGSFPIPYHVSGTATHRLSGADKINLQNLPSGRKKGQSTALREAIMAPQGYVVVAGDSGQVEVRVLAYIAQQLDLMQLFMDGEDPYLDLAATLYHTPYAEMKRLHKAKDPTVSLQRSTGKVGVLSLGYGAGAKSTQGIAKVQYGITLSDDEVKHLVSTYRTKNYAVPAMWNKVDLALSRMASGLSGSLLGPTGDLIYYDGKYTVAGEHLPAFRLPNDTWIVLPNLHEEIEVKNNTKRQKFVYNDIHARRVKPVSIWGGSATGLIVQGTAFALMKWQGLLMHEYGLRASLNTHDEFAVVVPEEHAAAAVEMMQTVMSMTPDWLQGAPIACDVGCDISYGRI